MALIQLILTTSASLDLLFITGDHPIQFSDTKNALNRALDSFKICLLDDPMESYANGGSKGDLDTAAIKLDVF